MSFSDRLKRARTARGLSQRALAELSGVHQPTIAAIEAGRREPSAAARHALEQALRIRPSEALKAHRDEILDAIERHYGADPHVIGSVARGTDTLDSDLDLMVTFLPGTTDLIDLMDLMDELADITGVSVDIVSGRAAGAVAEHARAEAVPL